MDRQSILGFVLIFVILMVWMWANAPTPKPPTAAGDSTAAVIDTAKPPAVEKKTPRALKSVARDTVQQTEEEKDPFGRYFRAAAKGKDEDIVVETDDYRAVLTTKGALVKTWQLKHFKTWDGRQVQLVDYKANGDLNVRFMSTDGRLIETRNLYFDAGPTPETVTITGKDEKEIRFTLRSSNGGTITKIYRFRNGAYDFDVQVVLDHMEDVIANYKYELAWDSGLQYSERNSVDESNFTSAHIYSAGEHMQLDATHFDEPVKMDHQGEIDWVASSTKYFLLAIIPQKGAASAAYLEGDRVHKPNKGEKENYSLTLEIPYKGNPVEQEHFKVFLGPADYHLLTTYNIGLENVIYLGWTWIVRPISVYIMLPVFSLLHTIIPNWGIVLIIFAIIIKVVLHPLTKTSMKSMKKMQMLQPMMEEIRTKYKDDPQKMNAQIMNLYKEYGVNPAGGCLPMVLQFPILIALYNVFRAAIELRQAGFFWWITDLSIPDKLFTLPFAIPVFGVQEVSGLALLMGITTFIQQKMSVKDPRQKTMVYMMPVMMTLLFNSFPSGLNLYYFMFNLLSIGQQMFINKQHDKEPLRKIDRKKPKRGGVFGRLGDIPRINKKT